LPDGTVAVANWPVRVELCGPDGGPAVALQVPPKLESGTNPLLAADPTGKRLAVAWMERPFDRSRVGEPPVQLQVLVWDLSLRRLIQFQTHNLTPRVIPKSGGIHTLLAALQFNSTGTRLAIAWKVEWDDNGATTPPNGVVWVNNPDNGEIVFRGRTSYPVHAVGFDPAGRPVAAGGPPDEGRLVAWDLATGKEAWSIRGHTQPVLGFGFGPGGRLATGSADQSVKLWDVAAGRELITLEGHTRDVTLIQFASDGRLITATGLDRLGLVTAPGGVPASFRRPPEVKVWAGAK
jgi:WD40 repeat protein